MTANSLHFAAAVRDLCEASRHLGLDPPTFRSPPAGGTHRTIRRRTPGGATVAIQIRGRPWGAVVADMIEGIIVANHLQGMRADTVRDDLWRVMEDVVTLSMAA